MHAQIGWLYVFPAHRGGGVGTRMLKAAEQRILNLWPKDTICLLANDDSVDFWKRMGYEHVDKGLQGPKYMQKLSGNAGASSTSALAADKPTV